MNDELELSPAAGFVEAQLSDEFPGLRLDWVTVEGGLRDSPPPLRQRLRHLSNRYRGASVITMRTQPIPHAYRAFFRQVGLDPDSTRIPSERAGVARLLQGQFCSLNILEDALLIALLETGVPLWALDGDLVDVGGLGIRTSAEGERLGPAEQGHDLPAGRLVVADANTVHAVLFDDVAPGHEVTRKSSRIAIFAVGVDGVPAIHVEEAVWVCAELLSTRP